MAHVRVFAPATVSNVGPGFDIMGFALHRPGDTVSVDTSDRPGVAMGDISGDDGRLPRAPAANAAAAAASSVWQAAATAGVDVPPGLMVSLEKGLPLQSGLGGSGASAAAGAVATNLALGSPFTPAQLVTHAMAGERAACGSAHADNVAPAILGGFVLIRSYTPLDLVSLPVPDGLFVAIGHPHCVISTRRARAMLAGRTFALPDIVANTGNAAAMVAALHQGDLALLGRCIEDRLVEPLRASLVPGYAGVRAAALGAGALAFAISGSGPTVFALADREDAAARVAAAMKAAFLEAGGLRADAWIGAVSRRGARPVG